MAAEKNDARTRIIRYLTKSDITLTSDEESILARWEMADLLMRTGTRDEDIILKVTVRFGVSKHTAQNDIFAAHEVFGKSRQINRNYLSHLHLQDISEDLKRYRKHVFETKDKKGQFLPPTEKEMLALSRMHDAYTRQLRDIPQEIQPINVDRPNIIFQLVTKEDQAQLQAPMDIMQAMRLSYNFLNKTEEAEIVPPDEPTE